MKRPVVKYILETIIPEFRKIGVSLTYIQGTRDEKLYYGKNTIQHIKERDGFDLISDFNEVSPEDIVSREDLLQCLRADLYMITYFCAYHHNTRVDLDPPDYDIFPNILIGSKLGNGGELVHIGSFTSGFDKERALKKSSKEMDSRITYKLGDNIYFKDVIEFTYHYRNSLMKFK